MNISTYEYGGSNTEQSYIFIVLGSIQISKFPDPQIPRFPHLALLSGQINLNFGFVNCKVGELRAPLLLCAEQPEPWLTALGRGWVYWHSQN